MLEREIATRLVLQRAVLEMLTDANKELRAECAGGMRPGDATVVETPDGERLGRVRMDRPRTSVRLVDETALVEWCRAHRPSELEYRVRPAFAEALRKSGGVLVDHETGEMVDVPGFEATTAAAGTLTVEVGESARAAAAVLVARIGNPPPPAVAS